MEPDRFQLTVDGDLFDVRYDVDQPGAYHYTWLSGPNEGYGFTSRRSDEGRATSVDQHVQAIRRFLAQIDPETGYID
jgi:hypothetical protein